MWEKLLYVVGILASMAYGTVLLLMTLIFGNFVSVFTDFALDRIPSDNFRRKLSLRTIQKKYFNIVLHQRIAYHETKLTSGAVSLALSTHSNSTRSGLAKKFGLSLKSASTVVATFIVALHSQWKLALVTATIIPAVIVAVGATCVFDEKKEESLNTIKAEATKLADEVISSIRTVRARGAEKALGNKYDTMIKRAVAIGLSKAPVKGV
ncbi:ABC transporter type 1, transmembrane domain-containing protein [Talaromyces proteolyticus]|uniref:ABC transporter type 1, transmembrane domain-containing protein n=1 Tax=Talaromyces proteolyticus TaxID=1131652 RepID=A0AAD4KE00_9EURO|nr:ABC transporter type 1, transmembrane domain-containing protein [Talaromyces proteolyticus]KAH8689602.1 ABC transporter type 1, transmembrane domain-containing protein [Talaromyces proteolyticus]